jgi:hypothetical protein
MSKLFEGPIYKRHPDDEWFDEIRVETAEGPLLRIITQYRYKTSNMSGDEWRTSASIQVRRGNVWSDFDNRYVNLETASKGLYPGFYTSHPELHEVETTTIDFYRKGIKLYESSYDGRPLAFIHAAGHLPWALVIARQDSGQMPNSNDYCFQPGCAEEAISTYRLKVEYSKNGVFSREPRRELRRRFCLRHLRRGDCGLEDADENYEVIEGPGPDEAQGWQGDVSESRFGGFIDLTDL